MCIKILKLRKRKVVVNLASRRDSNNLIAKQTCELGGNKDLPCKDKEGRDNAPCRRGALDQSNLLAIARL